MAKELFQRTKDLEKYLIKNEFKKIKETYDLEAFGNELVVYASPKLKIRIVKDRGYFYIEALPVDLESEDWILITRVFDYIKNTVPSSLNLSEKKDEWNCLIDEICLNLSTLICFFDKNNYIENIKKLESYEENQRHIAGDIAGDVP